MAIRRKWLPGDCPWSLDELLSSMGDGLALHFDEGTDDGTHAD